MSIRVRQEYFDTLTKQEIGFHEIETSSKINARLTTECFAIQEALGTKYALSVEYLIFSQLSTFFLMFFTFFWRGFVVNYRNDE